MKLKLFKKNYPYLFWMTIIGVLHAFVYKLLLIEIPELSWFQKASELGDVFYNLQLGFLASIIFFYLVVFLKEIRQKEMVSKKVEYHSSLIIAEGLSLFFNFTNGQKGLTFPPSLQYCEQQCLTHDSRITLTINSKGRSSWYSLVKSTYDAISFDITNLNDLPMTLVYFQNDQLIGIITKLKDAGLFSYFNRRVHWVWNEPQPNEVSDISHLKTHLFDFFQIISELIELHEAEFGKESLSSLKKRYLLEDEC
ncbi:MAG: hypothetical protein ACK4WD_13000 [Flavobacteriales bacterium]|jgi:hypothetical protein